MNRALTVELGMAWTFIGKDPDWWKKCAVAGLFFFIPFVGPVAVLAWERRLFDAYKAGDTVLPSPKLGDLGYGVAPFVARLNLAVPILVLMVLMGLLVGITAGVGSAAGDNESLKAVVAMVMGVGMLGFYAVLFLFIFVMQLCMPELSRRGYRGEMGPLFSPGPSIRAIRAHGSAYFLTLVGHWLYGLVGGLGVMLCYVGMIFTLPMALAFQAVMTAQWDAVVGDDA